MEKRITNVGVCACSLFFPLGNAKPDHPLPYDEVSPGRSEVGESPLPNEKHTAGLVAIESIKFIEE